MFSYNSPCILVARRTPEYNIVLLDEQTEYDSHLMHYKIKGLKVLVPTLYERLPLNFVTSTPWVFEMSFDVMTIDGSLYLALD